MIPDKCVPFYHCPDAQPTGGCPATASWRGSQASAAPRQSVSSRTSKERSLGSALSAPMVLVSQGDTGSVAETGERGSFILKLSLLMIAAIVLQYQ